MVFLAGNLPSILDLLFRSASADGLSFENVPPSVIAGRPISLFVKVDPQILTAESRGNASLDLRLFDPTNNQTIPHVTYFVHAIKDYKDMMTLSFHSHRGPLKLNIHPHEGPITVLNGQWQQTHGAWQNNDNDGVLDVETPLLLDSGLYHFQITILGMTDDQNFFDPDIAPIFDSWLSVGESFQTRIRYDNGDHDLTIVSYYDKLSKFNYDPSNFTIFWSMPFNWNLERLQSPNNNIFVHEEVRVPKSFIKFLNSTSFVPTVNNIPLTGMAVAVDPYTSEGEYIVHYLINKPAILQLAQIHDQKLNSSSENEHQMSFSLSINTNRKIAQETSTLFVTTAGIRVGTSWKPSQLSSNKESSLSINFSDAQYLKGTNSDVSLNADVRYDLMILDDSGSKVLERNNLVAMKGSDFQSMTFATNGTYQIIVNVTGIQRQGQSIDQSRNGIGSGIVVVPEFGSAAAIAATAAALITAALIRHSKATVKG